MYRFIIIIILPALSCFWGCAGPRRAAAVAGGSEAAGEVRPVPGAGAALSGDRVPDKQAPSAHSDTGAVSRMADTLSGDSARKTAAGPAKKVKPEAPGRPAEEKPGLGEWLKMKVGRKEEPGVEVTKKASEFAVPGPPQEFEEPVPKAKPKAVPKPEPAPKAVPKPKPVPKAVPKPAGKGPPKPPKEELKRKAEVEKTLQQAKQAVKDRLFEEVPEAKERIKPVGLGDIIGMVTKPKPKPKVRKRKKPKVPGKELKEAAKLIEEAGKMGYSAEESITLLLQAGFSPAVTTAIMRQALKK